MQQYIPGDHSAGVGREWGKIQSNKRICSKVSGLFLFDLPDNWDKSHHCGMQHSRSHMICCPSEMVAFVVLSSENKGFHESLIFTNADFMSTMSSAKLLLHRLVSFVYTLCKLVLLRIGHWLLCYACETPFLKWCEHYKNYAFIIVITLIILWHIHQNVRNYFWCWNIFCMTYKIVINN